MFNVAAPRLRTASPAEADRSLARGTCPLGSESWIIGESKESFMNTALLTATMFYMIIFSNWRSQDQPRTTWAILTSSGSGRSRGQ